jgi:hypothetical protein
VYNPPLKETRKRYENANLSSLPYLSRRGLRLCPIHRKRDAINIALSRRPPRQPWRGRKTQVRNSSQPPHPINDTSVEGECFEGRERNRWLRHHGSIVSHHITESYSTSPIQIAAIQKRHHIRPSRLSIFLSPFPPPLSSLLHPHLIRQEGIP